MRVAAAALVGVLTLAGCSSTQEKSARLKRAAVDRPAEKAFVVTKRNPDVRIGRGTVLRDENGVAVVLPLRSTAAAPQGAVPVSFELLDRGGKRVYRNDLAGLDVSLIQASLLAPRKELLWVDDQIQPTAKPVRARALAGIPDRPVKGDPPRVTVGALKLEDDPTEGVAIKGSVTNASGVDQKRLVVFIVARRGKRITAAGRSIIPRLKPQATVKFTAFLIGDARGAKLSAAAPPTTLR